MAKMHEKVTDRYHLRNETHMIEFPRTAIGLEQAQDFRSRNDQFKGRQIKQILQLQPSDVDLGKVYPLAA